VVARSTPVQRKEELVDNIVIAKRQALKRRLLREDTAVPTVGAGSRSFSPYPRGNRSASRPSSACSSRCQAYSPARGKGNCQHRSGSRIGHRTSSTPTLALADAAQLAPSPSSMSSNGGAPSVSSFFKSTTPRTPASRKRAASVTSDRQCNPPFRTSLSSRSRIKHDGRGENEWSIRSRPSSAPRRVTSTQPGSDLGVRADLWALQYRKKLELRQHMKVQKEHKELQQCTFQPNLRRTMSSPIRPEAQKEVIERLYREGDMRYHLREKAKSLLEMEELASMTFQPKVNSDNKVPSSPSAFLSRVDDTLEKKKNNILAKQMEEEMKFDHTFTPALSTKSEQIVQKKRSEARRNMDDSDVLEPVENRLYNISTRENKKSHDDNDKNLNGGVSTTSRMARKSEEIIKSSVYFKGPYKSFLQRQRAFQDAKEKRLDLFRQNNIGPSPKFSPRMVEVRCQRMGPGEYKLREDKRKEKQERQFEEQCPFAPDINPVSRVIGSVVGSKDRVFDRLSGTPKEKQERRVDEEQHSFQPSVDSSGRYAHIQPHYNKSAILSQIKYDQRIRERKLNELRQKEKEKAVKDCTFQPQFAPPPRIHRQKPKIVSGFDRFLELQTRARIQREDKILKEKPRCADGYTGVTITEPFQLSDNCKRRRDVVHEKDEEKKRREYTFHPNTIEREKKDLLQKFLVAR